MGTLRAGDGEGSNLSDDDKTISTDGSTPRSTARPLSSVRAQFAKTSMSLSLAIEDLTQDALLEPAPRIEYEGRTVPVLGGIPLIAKLGQGGMGAVYYGVKPLLRAEVAVKVLPVQLAMDNESMVDRFLREAHLAASIESPHLIRVTDVNEENGLFFLVMEYIGGLTAGALVARSKKKGRIGIEEGQALDIAIAVAKGLAAAHDRQVIHRDVKPDNILVPVVGGKLSPKATKLVDLGLARGEDPGSAGLTSAQAAMGTPGYMAPEQALNPKNAGKPADVFGLGAALYAMLAGRAPFSGRSVTETVINTIQGPYDSMSPDRVDVSQPTLDLIDRCLEKEPEARFADAHELLAALEECRAACEGGDPISNISGVSEAQPIASRALSRKTPGRVDRTQLASSLEGSGGGAAGVGGFGRRAAIAAAGLVFLAVAGVVAWPRIGGSGDGAAKSGTPTPGDGVVRIGIACSAEKYDWMLWAVDLWRVSGRKEHIEIVPMSAGDMETALKGCDERIHVWSPASTLHGELAKLDAKKAGRASPFHHEERLALTPMVFLTFADRHAALVARYGRLDFAAIHRALVEDRDWETISKKPEWGDVTFGITDPRVHGSGLATWLVLAANFHGKNSSLDPADVMAPPFVRYSKSLAEVVTQDGSSVDTIKDMVLEGPSKFDGIITYESNAIAFLMAAEGRWGEVRIDYPAINYWNENPYQILDVPWSTEETRRVAMDFCKHLMSEAPQRRLVDLGFRPGNPLVPIITDQSPFKTLAGHGVTTEIARVTPTPRPEVLRALLERAQPPIVDRMPIRERLRDRVPR